MQSASFFKTNSSKTLAMLNSSDHDQSSPSLVRTTARGAGGPGGAAPRDCGGRGLSVLRGVRGAQPPGIAGGPGGAAPRFAGGFGGLQASQWCLESQKILKIYPKRISQMGKKASISWFLIKGPLSIQGRRKNSRTEILPET